MINKNYVLNVFDQNGTKKNYLNCVVLYTLQINWVVLSPFIKYSITFFELKTIGYIFHFPLTILTIFSRLIEFSV